MQLRDIEYFAAVAAHGSVRRAAESLGMTQPAISKSLRRLESAVQARLVNRTPQGVELTSVGVTLLSQVSRIRLTLDDVAREAADLGRGLAGRLRIAASPAVAEYLAPIYAVLLQQAPKLTLQVIAADNDVTLTLLRAGELDFIFNYIPSPAYEDTAHEHLFDEEWAVFASANHRLAKLKRVAISDLVNERWTLSVPALLNTLKLTRFHGHLNL